MSLTADTSDFETRLEAAMAGDDAAWRWLFRQISGRVVAFLVARGASDPEGVAGDTFLDIVKSIRRFRGDERDFVSWSLTIAHRRLIDAQRASSRRREVVTDPVDIEQPDPGDVEDSALELVEATRARRLLDHLTSDQADVIALRIYGELTLPEIAHHLAKPLTAVTSLQHRGLERLRRLLTDPE
ncbi:MAG: RNA polymerase sigma factor [Acidimicrobiia bacterium]